jgi:preprotein translocase subunit SecF
MFKPLHIVPAGTRIDFMHWHKIAFVISLVLVLASFGSFLAKGLNFGIDFSGGIRSRRVAPVLSIWPGSGRS